MELGVWRRPPAAPSPQGQKSYFFLPFLAAFFFLAGI
jgi:hypothetical protein